MIPTLAVDSKLDECVGALSRQTLQQFEVIVVDNSGRALARDKQFALPVSVLTADHNLGFGAAVNRGIVASTAPYVACLNDDAVPHPGWLAALVGALDRRTDAGMCASQVRLFGEERLDSAGMLISGDGSSKQRGHGRPTVDFPVLEETLFPSGSACLYRRAMLDDVGGFDDHFFLYCEDTDLGLRARWAGWKCLYAPGAMVDHHCSHSAGKASPLKAYYVERNRLFVLAKNFPVPLLLRAPLVSFARYFWHLCFILQGRGSAARFRAEGNASPRMALFVLRAHFALVAHAARLVRQRRQIRARARITPAVFRHLLRSHSISARRVAAL